VADAEGHACAVTGGPAGAGPLEDPTASAVRAASMSRTRGLTDYLGIGRLIWEHALGSYVMQRTQKCLAAAPPGYIGEYPEQRDLIRAPQWVD
jgi:hypothetical protein